MKKLLRELNFADALTYVWIGSCITPVDVRGKSTTYSQMWISYFFHKSFYLNIFCWLP